MTVDVEGSCGSVSYLRQFIGLSAAITTLRKLIPVLSKKKAQRAGTL